MTIRLTVNEAAQRIAERVADSRFELGIREALERDIAEGLPCPTEQDIEELIGDNGWHYVHTSIELEWIRS